MNTIHQEGGVIQNYVAGFLFDKTRENVLLIDKLKPAWQRGLFNGVGGKIEHGETPYEAMFREFEEEAGLSIFNWRQFAKIRWPRAVVYFFETAYEYELSRAKQMTDEELIVVPVAKIPELRTIPNLRWLVPLAASTEGYQAEVQSFYFEGNNR